MSYLADGPEEPELRTFCADCGEYLPEDWGKEGPDVEPEIYHRKMAETEFRDVDTGEVVMEKAPVPATEEEADWTECYGPWWTCPECGYEHGPDEAWW